MRRLIVTGCAAALALGMNLFAIAPASAKTASDVAAVALAHGKNRQKMLVEGAKKEGKLTVYCAMPTRDMLRLTKAFTKEYGVKVTVWRSSSEGVVQRMVTEARGGRYDVDFVQNNAPSMAELMHEKLLQPVNSPYQADLIPGAVPSHRYWAGLYILAFVQTYNTNKIKKSELPHSWRDLLNPRWKGDLGVEADDGHWLAYVMKSMGEKKGERLFREIVHKNGITVRKGHTLLAKLVVSGEIPMALDVYSYKAVQLKDEGAPLNWFVIPPAIAQFTAIGLAKHAAHPHAAVLFYDFLLGKGQKILFKHHYVPTSTKIDTPLNKMPMKFIDPTEFIKMDQQWINTYNSILGIQ